MPSLAVALLVVVLATFVNPPPAPTMASDLTTDSEVEAAIRFRSAFGLRADRAYVEGTFQRPDAAEGQFGLPLSATEAADLRARLDIQTSLHKGVIDFALTLPGYAGAAIDQQRGGLPRFYFAADPTAYESALRSRLPGTAFEVVRVDRSEADLLSLKREVWSARQSLRDEGVDVVSAGIDTPQNVVAVGVRSDLGRATAVLASRFGQGVRVFAGEAGQADACQSMHECWPPKGGFEIDPCTASVPNCTLNPPYAASCTSGFVGRRLSDNYVGLITAGHCFVRSAQGPNGAGGTTAGSGKEWRHNQHLLGRANSNTWFNGSDADVGFIALYSNRWPTVKNEFIADDSPITVDRVDVWVHANNQLVGDLVCRVGRTTGRRCGSIIRREERNDSCLNNQSNCRDIDHTFVVIFDSSGGDSGGPVFTPSSSVEAYGIHTHSESDSPDAVGWYSAISWAQVQYRATTGVDLKLCVTPGC